MTGTVIAITCATALIVSLGIVICILKVTIWSAPKPSYTSDQGIDFYPQRWDKDKDETGTALPTRAEVTPYLAEVERQLALFLIGRGVLSVGTSDLRKVLSRLSVYWREGIMRENGYRFHDPHAWVIGGSGWYAGLRDDNELTVANTPLVEDGALAHEIGHVIAEAFLGYPDRKHERFPELWEIVG